jgi:hypothetical protein
MALTCGKPGLMIRLVQGAAALDRSDLMTGSVRKWTGFGSLPGSDELGLPAQDLRGWHPGRNVVLRQRPSPPTAIF